MFWPFQLCPAGPRVIRLLRGDIARCEADAIAVSANPNLEGTLRSNYWRFAGRRNADGAVRLAGGRSLADETAKVSAHHPNPGHPGHPGHRAADALIPHSPWPQLRRSVGELAPESAIVGRAGRSLRARWVVHCVAPDAVARTADEHAAYLLEPTSYERGLSQRLQATYTAAISAATKAGASSLAVPALGCGIRGFARDQAAAAAFRAAAAWLQTDSITQLRRLDFVILADDVWAEWPRHAHAELGPPDGDTDLRLTDGDNEIHTWSEDVAGLV